MKGRNKVLNVSALAGCRDEVEGGRILNVRGVRLPPAVLRYRPIEQGLEAPALLASPRRCRRHVLGWGAVMNVSAC